MEVIDTVVRFLNCYMLDSDYNNTINFTNKQTQIQWFNQHVKWLNEEFDYQRKNNNIKVGYNLDELKLINYLIIDNSNGERFFYFVMEKEYISDNVTNLIIKLDLIQTYQFDITFKDCQVERQHIEQYYESSEGNVIANRVGENVNEGLDTGDYSLVSNINLYDYMQNGCYIFTSSERLGVSTDERINFSEETGGGGNPSNNNYSNGYMDKNGMRMIKSFEGFASIPYNIGDGTDTTGYGTTSVYSTEAFNSLLPSCTEQEASIVLGEFAYSSYSIKVKQQLDDDNYNWDNMTQDLFNAMVSFAWNSGAYAMSINYPTLWNMILNGYNKTNTEELKNTWAITNIMEGSIYEEGLRKRRKIEGEIAVEEYDYMNFIIGNVTEGGYITDNEGFGYIPTEYK